MSMSNKGKVVEGMTLPEKKLLVLRCPYCGSMNVRADALAAWSVEDREWQIITAYDNKSCGDCEMEFDIASEEYVSSEDWTKIQEKQ